MTVTGKVQKFKMREDAIDAARAGDGGRHPDRLSGCPGRLSPASAR